MLKVSLNTFFLLSIMTFPCMSRAELPAGYNASAMYSSSNAWNLFLTGDYIYWAWQQDSLKMGSRVNAVNGNSTTIFQNPGYASGFQVGLGFDIPQVDHWDLYAEYTWYKNSVTTSIDSDAVNLFQKDGRRGSFYLNGIATSEVGIKFDALDVLLQRPFYLGKKLTANFSTGLNALWITQNVKKSGNGFRQELLTSSPLAFSSRFSQDLSSWGLGPKFKLETNWNLGLGLQFMANLSTSLLYTSYNLKDLLTINSTHSTFDTLHNYNVLRPITEAFLGLGWNRNLCNNRFHISTSAGYDFNVYWNYDMLNYITFKEKSDIYLQGLNIQVRFDF